MNNRVISIIKTIQQTLNADKNEGLRLYRNKSSNNKTSTERKIMADEPTPRKEIVDADAWMNIGGKGFFVKIDGKEYITSIDSVKALLSGEKQGVKLGMLKE